MTTAGDGDIGCLRAGLRPVWRTKDINDPQTDTTAAQAILDQNASALLGLLDPDTLERGCVHFQNGDCHV